jgi:hypothetical protein
MDLLINELAREDGDPNVRQAAGIAAKNTLTAKVCKFLFNNPIK